MSESAASERERRLETALRMIASSDEFRIFEETPPWSEVLTLPADEFPPRLIARAALEDE